MAFIPFNARVSVTPTGGLSGAWLISLSLTDGSSQFGNSDLAVNQIVFTSDSLTGHVVAWRIDEINGGAPAPLLGPVPVRVSYYDPRATPSTEPVGGPELDPTGFICQPAPSGEFVVASWQLNFAEQRKAAEIENLNKLFNVSTGGEKTTYGAATPATPAVGDQHVYTAGNLHGIAVEWNGTAWQYVDQTRIPLLASQIAEGDAAHTDIVAALPAGGTYRYMVLRGSSYSEDIVFKNGVIYRNAMGAIVATGSGSGSSVTVMPGWSVVNPSTDRTLDDGASTTLQDVTRVLGSVIEDLKSAGVFAG